MSPDTDLYVIGLPILISFSSKSVFVQLSMLNDSYYVNVNSFISALGRDPGLFSFPVSKCPNLLQFLYIVSGCDYTSFWAGHGKVSFMNCLFRYSEFISNRYHSGVL